MSSLLFAERRKRQTAEGGGKQKWVRMFCLFFLFKSNYVLFCYIILCVTGCMFQVWRKQHRLLGVTRSGYAELRDYRSGLVTETKPDGNEYI